jgi:hypothetical protein
VTITSLPTPEAPAEPDNGYRPGQIPESDVRPPPSVWTPGDVHHTHEQVWDESPAGVQAANAPDPRDAEILRLNAIIAGTSKDPNYVPEAADPRDVELARLRSLVAGEGAGPVEATAATVDPRDAEIATLKADLEARQVADDAAKADPADVQPVATEGSPPATA